MLNKRLEESDAIQNVPMLHAKVAQIPDQMTMRGE
jgi:hypothetical protein